MVTPVGQDVLFSSQLQDLQLLQAQWAQGTLQGLRVMLPFFSLKYSPHLCTELTETSQEVNMRKSENSRKDRQTFWVNIIKGNLQRARKLVWMRQKVKNSHRISFRSSKYLYFILIWFFSNSLSSILFMGRWGHYGVFLYIIMIDTTNVVC